MATTITMPKLGLTMNSGSVQQWKKKIGDSVKKGELLYAVATDKLTVDVESPADGVLLAITIKDGEEVPIGAPIGVIGAAGEKVETKASAEPVVVPSSPVGMPGPAASTPDAGQRVAHTKSGVVASPKAKALARKNGVDLSAVRGTGPEGWIVARDVSAASQAATATKASPVAARMANDAGIDLAGLDTGKRVMKADVLAAMPAPNAAGRRVPISQMRRIIGSRMLQSVSTIPSVNYTVDVDMSALNELRASYNARLDKKSLPAGKNIKISINDILMKLCAKLLLESPMVNASVEPDAFVLHDFVNVGFAVALPGGLVVPNVKDVHVKSLTQIAQERAELVEKSRSGGLTPDCTTGGTFTISNLGMMGVTSFTPIINPPEAAILGVGTTTDRPVVIDGSVVVRPVSTLCLTADHRLVDGADGAAFLANLKELIEHPDLFLL